MKISIITATYNAAASIADTQRSLGIQDYSRDQIEWIVIDGASTDRTLDLIRTAAFQPDQLISEPDKGIYDALNKGIGMATGDIIGFLHADDFFASPNVLTRIACAFRNSGADAVYGDLQYVRKMENGTFSTVRTWKSGIYDRGKLHWGWMPPHPAFYVKREVYERTVLANGDYYNTSYSCAADYDFMLRIFSKYGIEPAYLKWVLVKMQLGGVSNRSLKHILQKSLEDWRIIRGSRIGHVHTLACKNLRKVGQFFIH